MTGTAVVWAPAKVNLALRVLYRRPDGFHEIDTLFQAIDLADRLAVSVGDDGVELTVDGPDLGPVEANLAHRAAVAFLAAAGRSEGVRIGLEKRIPAGAGLGGGSSDAAAVLAALSALVGGVAREDLLAIAAGLGSDVPFFLGESPLARAGGRGELLSAMAPLPAADLVLVSPPVHVDTAAAYRLLSAERRRGPADARPDWRVTSWDDVRAVAVNDFQDVMAGRYPQIRRSLDALVAAGADPALMTGSGSTCYGRFSDAAASGSAAVALEAELGWPCRAASTLESLPKPVVA